MHIVRPRQDREMVMTVTIDPTKISRGHLHLTGSGIHRDKRDRRTTRRSRDERAIREWS